MNLVSQRNSAGTDINTAEQPASRQLLTFISHSKLYALEILHVREIIQAVEMTPVPMMPEFVRGVINLRGKVVPVIDLACRFGHGLAVPGRRSSIVIVEAAAEDPEDELQALGILVDAVSEVIDVTAEDLLPPPMFGTQIRADFISQMVRRGAQFVPLLALATLLAAHEIAGLVHTPEISQTGSQEQNHELSG